MGENSKMDYEQSQMNLTLFEMNNITTLSREYKNNPNLYNFKVQFLSYIHNGKLKKNVNEWIIVLGFILPEVHNGNSETNSSVFWDRISVQV